MHLLFEPDSEGTSVEKTVLAVATPDALMGFVSELFVEKESHGTRRQETRINAYVKLLL